MNSNNVHQQEKQNGQPESPKINDMARNRILVTGGAGFIGSHLATWLLQQGHHVTIFDDFSGGFKRNIPKLRGVTWAEGSVTDVSDVDDLFKRSKFDYVFHLAAYAAEGLSHFIRNFNYTNNLIGTTNIVNACVNYNVRHLTFTSSIAVYGNDYDGMRASEDSPCHPIDPYGVAKLACEHDIASAGHYFGLNYTVFRLHNVYGINQNIGDPYRNVIGIFMNQIMKGQPMTIIGDGQQVRNFTNVLSIVPVLAEAPSNAQMWGEVFNVGSDKAYTITHLAQMVETAMGTSFGTTFVSDRKESRGIIIDHTKLKNVFYMADMPIQAGLNHMAEWAKVHGSQPGQPFGTMEIREELPEFWRGIVKEGGQHASD